MAWSNRLSGFLSGSSTDGDGESGTGDGDRASKFQVVARDRDGTAHQTPDAIESGEWVYEGEPPTKEQFRFEYGKHLEPGIRYVCVPLKPLEGGNGGARPDFGDVQWSHEPDRGRGAGGGDIPPWAEEMMMRMDEMEQPAAGDLDELLVREIAKTDGPRTALDELKQMRALESGNGPAPLSESVSDPTNAKEIAGRGFLQMAENYNSFGEMVEDVLGGALQGASGMPTAGPQAQAQGHAQAQEPQQVQNQPAADAGQAREGPATETAPAPADASAPPADEPASGGAGGATERSSSLRSEFGDVADTQGVDGRPQAEAEGATGDDATENERPPVPDSPRALREQGYRQWQSHASAMGHETNGIGVEKDTLFDWVASRMFDDYTADADPDPDPDPAAEATPGKGVDQTGAGPPPDPDRADSPAAREQAREEADTDGDGEPELPAPEARADSEVPVQDRRSTSGDGDRATTGQNARPMTATPEDTPDDDGEDEPDAVVADGGQPDE